VDAFIVSDELASRFSQKGPFRSGTNVPEIKVAQRAIDKELRSMPGMEGLRPQPFTFRIFTQEEIERLAAAGDAQRRISGSK
jgi:hypothetical protein